MKCSDINIRDPFVLNENGTYYMYGTRGASFGLKTGGFDVYVSNDLVNWSEPVECFDSNKFGMNLGANWAPEVHKYNGKYYMFATFAQEDKIKGTFILKSDFPQGPFVPHSKGAVTPQDCECLDGTLYVDKSGVPYIVYCHEHSQIIDGTICYARLSDDLSERVGEPITIFAASSHPLVTPYDSSGHLVTDGPFMFRSKSGELLMLWSSFVKGEYAEMVARFEGGELGTRFTHLPPLIDNDGGHGMLFQKDDTLYLTLHSPNKTTLERPVFIKLEDDGDRLSILS